MGNTSFPTLVFPTAAQPMHFTLSRAKWHMDPGSPVSLVLVHDVLAPGAGRSWSSFVRSVQLLPREKRYTPITPLDFYAPDLRGHGRTEGWKDGNTEDVILSMAHDLVHFQKTAVEHKTTHLIGCGAVGAAVAQIAALSEPHAFQSLSLLKKAPGAAEVYGLPLKAEMIEQLVDPANCSEEVRAQYRIADGAVTDREGIKARAQSFVSFPGSFVSDRTFDNTTLVDDTLTATLAAASQFTSTRTLSLTDVADSDVAFTLLKALDLITVLPEEQPSPEQ